MTKKTVLAPATAKATSHEGPWPGREYDSWAEWPDEDVVSKLLFYYFSGGAAFPGFDCVPGSWGKLWFLFPGKEGLFLREMEAHNSFFAERSGGDVRVVADRRDEQPVEKKTLLLLPYGQHVWLEDEPSSSDAEKVEYHGAGTSSAAVVSTRSSNGGEIFYWRDLAMFQRYLLEHPLASQIVEPVILKGEFPTFRPEGAKWEGGIGYLNNGGEIFLPVIWVKTEKIQEAFFRPALGEEVWFVNKWAEDPDSKGCVFSRRLMGGRWEEGSSIPYGEERMGEKGEILGRQQVFFQDLYQKGGPAAPLVDLELPAAEKVA